MLQKVSRKSMITGLRLFIIMTLAGLILIFYFTGSRETLNAFRQFKMIYFLYAFLLVGVDYLLGAGRIFVFIRQMGIQAKKAFGASIRANLGNMFMAAVTPFQTGGGFAQIYILNRAGLTVSGALAVSILNYIATLTFLLSSGFFVLQWIKNTFPDFKLQFILTISTTAFYFSGVMFFLFVFKPLWVGRLFEKLLEGLGKIWKKKKDSFSRISTRIHDFVVSYRNHNQFFWEKGKWALFHNFWMTFLLFLNKCFIAYVIIKGMGFDPPVLTVIAIHILLIFVLYFCPTPGASFFAETSAAALMSLILPKHALVVFPVIWRFFITYFAVILGGIILMRAIGKQSVSLPLEKTE